MLLAKVYIWSQSNMPPPPSNGIRHSTFFISHVLFWSLLFPHLHLLYLPFFFLLFRFFPFFLPSSFQTTLFFFFAWYLDYPSSSKGASPTLLLNFNNSLREKVIPETKHWARCTSNTVISSNSFILSPPTTLSQNLYKFHFYLYKFFVKEIHHEIIFLVFYTFILIFRTRINISIV